jgi:hypothetical protein
MTNWVIFTSVTKRFSKSLTIEASNVRIVGILRHLMWSIRGCGITMNLLKRLSS